MRDFICFILLIAFNLLFTLVSATNITFDISLIPKVKHPLPAFSLGSPITFSDSLLKGILHDISPRAKLTRTTKDGRGRLAVIGERVIGVRDPDTGEWRFYPNYEALEPIVGPEGPLNSIFIDNPDLFPRDDTNINVIRGPTLYQRQHTPNGTEPAPEARLQHVIAQRLVTFKDSKLPVLGPGSSAIFGFGPNGTLKSLKYLWHPAKHHKTVAPIDIKSTYHAIFAQVKTLAPFGPVNVTKVDLVYYDSGAKFIQPVFAFTATRLPAKAEGNDTGEPLVVSGYVPLGRNALECIPDLLNTKKGTPPSQPDPETKTPTRSLLPRIFGLLNKRLPTVTVGRYVIRDSEAGFLQNAEDFGSTLAKYSGQRVNFAFKQYYWAYNWLYTTYKYKFVNAVNIALTEAHGNWHRFRTSPGNDRVYINNNPALDIPASGFGGGAGGSLAYWIIHACEVIPTETDYPGQPYHSFDYWWSIFNGLHAVMGFRTEGLLGDGVTGPFAKAVALGVGVVPAWMGAVLGSDSYRSGWTYEDGNRGGLVQPFGRGASVSVCGHTDDVVWDVENLGRPGCLWEWWYEN